MLMRPPRKRHDFPEYGWLIAAIFVALIASAVLLISVPMVAK